MIACIPTKGRLNTRTYKLFQEVGIEVYHFIEPQEYDEYQVPNKINIQQNNQGISYVRNFILSWAKDKAEWVIMCDDDVQNFGLYNNKTKKTTVTNASIWFEILEKAKKLPFEIVGISYRQHAWHEKKKYSINKKFTDVCVLMNVSKIKWQYREQFNLKEDRDFVLQTIKKGNGVLRLNHYCFGCPDVGTNKGGLQNEYKNKKDNDSAIKMAKEWYPYVELIKKENRIDFKFDFENFAKNNRKQYI